MSNRFYLKNFGLMLLALGFGFSPAPAYAGFQWVAPTQSTAPAPAYAGAEAPSPQSDAYASVTSPMQMQSPVVIDQGNQQPPATISSPVTPPPSLGAAPLPLSPVIPPPALGPAPPGQPETWPSNRPAPSPPPPVVIEGTGHGVANNELPPPVVIQGDANIKPASSPLPLSVPTPTAPVMAEDEQPVSVADGEVVSLSTPSSGSEASSPAPASGSSDVSYPVPLPSEMMPDSTTPADMSSVPTPTPIPRPTAVSAPVPAPPIQSPPPSPAWAAPVASPVMASASPPAPSSDVVHGFANHVPLAVALRQILPAGYGFSVDQNIDLSVLVSFKGGKPWRETLDEALAPADLVAHEQGQIVQIRYLAAKDSTSTASPSPNVAFTPAAGTLELPPSITPASGMAPVPPVTVPPAPGAVAGIPVIAASSTQQEWNAEPGDTLHKVLEEWSHRANVEFDWMAEYDYPLQASIHLKGNFENAVRELLTGFESAHPQPIAELHSNPRVGQMVLIVTTRGNSVD